MPRILSAQTALDRYFLETRCKLIEIAATLDRITEGAGADTAAADRRMTQIRAALDVLSSPDGEKAEHCQRVFSLQYEDGWPIPNAE